MAVSPVADPLSSAGWKLFAPRVDSIEVLLRLSLGIMFLWSALPKLNMPYDFLSSVYDYQLVSSRAGLVVAMLIPWLEIILAVCLVGGLFTSGAFLTASLLGGVFTFVQASAMYRGLQIGCGCSEQMSEGLVGLDTIWRPIALLIAATGGFFLVLRRSFNG